MKSRSSLITLNSYLISLESITQAYWEVNINLLKCTPHCLQVTLSPQFILLNNISNKISKIIPPVPHQQKHYSQKHNQYHYSIDRKFHPLFSDNTHKYVYIHNYVYGHHDPISP